MGGDAPPEIVGYHLEQAHWYRTELALPDAALGSRAAEQLERAARAAAARSDVRAAGALSARAAALLPDTDPAQPRLLLAHGEALRDGGALAKAGEVIEKAVAAARATGNAQIEWRARLLIATIRIAREPEGAVEPALEEAHAAGAVAAELGDDALAARSWELLASLAMIQGRLGGCLEAVEAGLRHARASGDRQFEARLVIQSAAALLYGSTSVAEGLRIVEEVHRRVGDVVMTQSFAAHVEGHLRARMGDLSAARAMIGVWRDHMRELGRETSYAASSTCLYEVMSLAGDWSAAEAVLREGYAIVEQSGDNGLRSTFAALLGEACLRQGRIDEAERYARLSIELGTAVDIYNEVYWREVLAQVLSARGQRDEAATLAREAVALADRTEFVEQHASARLALARALGGGQEAVRAVTEAADIYERKGNVVMRDRAANLLVELGR